MTNIDYTSKNAKIRNTLAGIAIIAAILVGLWLSLPDVEDMPEDLQDIPFGPVLTSFPLDVGTLVLGDAVSGAIDALTDSHQWSFTAAEGERVNIIVETYFHATLQLVDPDGNTLKYSPNDNFAGAVLCDVIMTLPGNYAIIVGTGWGAGDYTLSILTAKSDLLPDDPTPIQPGQAIENQTALCFEASYSFTAKAGDAVSITVNALDEQQPRMNLYKAADSVIPGDEIAQETTISGNSSYIENLAIEEDGEYILTVFQNAGRKMPFNLLVEINQ